MTRKIVHPQVLRDIGCFSRLSRAGMRPDLIQRPTIPDQAARQGVPGSLHVEATGTHRNLRLRYASAMEPAFPLIPARLRTGRLRLAVVMLLVLVFGAVALWRWHAPVLTKLGHLTLDWVDNAGG